jgi:sulfonate dioxygenase
MTSRVAGPLFDKRIRNHVPPDPPHKESVPTRDRAFFADPEKKQLFAAATRVEHLTESLGTYLEGVQLSQLNDAQKDELALLVAEVFKLRDFKN